MAANKQFDSAEKSQSIFHYIIKFGKYWPLFLIVTFLVIGFAFFYIKSTPSLFVARTSVIIQDSKKGIENSKIAGELNQLVQPTTVENEMEILQSNSLLQVVTDSLNLQAQIFVKKGWMVKSVGDNSPVRIRIQNPDSVIESTLISIEFGKGFVKLNGNTYPTDEWIRTKYGIIEVQQTAAIAEANVKYLLSILSQKSALAELRRNLDVSSNKLSSVIELTYTHNNPAIAEDILDKLLEAYKNKSEFQRSSGGSEAQKSIEGRLSLVKNELDSLDNKIESYKAQNDAFDIGSQSKIIIENIGENQKRLSDAKYKKSSLVEIEKRLVENRSLKGFRSSTAGLQDPLLLELLGKYQQIELEYESDRATMGENNPRVNSLNVQLTKLRENVLENVQSQIRNVSVLLENLQQLSSQSHQSLTKLPSQEKNLEDLLRIRDNKKLMFDNLNQKLEDAILSNSSLVPTVILDVASAELTPIAPKKGFIGFVAVFAIFMISALCIYGLQLFNDKLLFRAEIEAKTAIPIIAEIISMKRKVRVHGIDLKSSILHEQMKRMRVAIDQTIGRTTKAKTVLITSAISGEGKSFVTANLGKSLAKSGKRVVVVECDFRNPSISEYVTCSNKNFLSDFILGPASIVDITTVTSDSKNLSVIFAGETKEDTSLLLSNEKLNSLFQSLSANFDYILIDTAPIALLSDAFLLSEYVDLTILVMRINHSPKTLLSRLENSIQINQFKNIGIVLNGVSTTGLAKFHPGNEYLADIKNRKYFGSEVETFG